MRWMEAEQQRVRGTVCPPTQGTARGREWQIAQLIEDDRVDLGELLGQISGFARSFFPFQKPAPVD